MFVYGHSAGGHLAVCALATDWKTYDMPENAVPAACAISGLFDLTPLIGISMNQDLRLTDADAREASPLFWPAPSGCTLEAWCGALESSEFRRQNRIIAEAWAKAGVNTVCQEVADANHFTVIDPLSDPESELTGRLAALAARTRS
jgi:arylformamidase